MLARMVRSPKRASRISSEIITDEQTTVWVDVVDPTPEEIARIGKEFEFHPLALEDVERGGQRPKIDQYDGYQFIVFYGLTTEADRCQSHEVDIFVGKHYMVTFHDERLAGHRRNRRAVARQCRRRWAIDGVGFLLYSLLDSLVDGYFPVLDDIAERADDSGGDDHPARASRRSRRRFSNCGASC